MTRFPRSVVLIAAAALLVTAAPASAPAAGDAPTATAAKSCSVGDFRSYNTTYVLWIRARNISCRKARRLVRRFHRCRPGVKGYCPSPGTWHCREDRGPFYASQYYSTVRCKKGAKRVKHRYQQNT